ncbi:MAG: hypothetical protein RLZZ502_210 [Pseudomonadota bacterium]|jgi:uncharacterized protein YutE (UPF0331/DUF86 family)
MDALIVQSKLESLRLCVLRLEQKCPKTLALLEQDIDAQDILSVNLSRAVQLCVDLAMHRIAGMGQKVPPTMAGCFELLQKEEVLGIDLLNQLKRAVGFRNLIVHQYDEIDWAIVFQICTVHLNTFKQFARIFN